MFLPHSRTRLPQLGRGGARNAAFTAGIGESFAAFVLEKIMESAREPRDRKLSSLLPDLIAAVFLTLGIGLATSIALAGAVLLLSAPAGPAW